MQKNFTQVQTLRQVALNNPVRAVITCMFLNLILTERTMTLMIVTPATTTAHASEDGAASATSGNLAGMDSALHTAMNGTLPSVKSTPKALVAQRVAQLVGTATVYKQPANEVAYNPNQDTVKNPAEKHAIAAELAQKYYDTCKPDDPHLRDSLGEAIDRAGLGHDVGLALWGMGKNHPNDPVLMGAKGANGKRTALSASELLHWPAEKNNVTNEKNSYIGGLDKLNNPRVQGLLDEIDFRQNSHATPNARVHGAKAIEKLASLSPTSPEWQTSNVDHFVSSEQQRIDLISAAKVVIAKKILDP